MKEPETENYYTIDINRKKYTFFCSDGEQHVQKLREKLTRIIGDLSSQEPGHVLSNYAMKIALLLADEAVREETVRLDQQDDVIESLNSMLLELDDVLGPEGWISCGQLLPIVTIIGPTKKTNSALLVIF